VESRNLPRELELTLVPTSPGGAGAVQVWFDGGDAVLQPGLAKDVLDLVWLGIDSPSKRGKGYGEAVVAALAHRFSGKKIKPLNVVPEAVGFWEKWHEEATVSVRARNLYLLKSFRKQQVRKK